MVPALNEICPLVEQFSGMIPGVDFESWSWISYFTSFYICQVYHYCYKSACEYIITAVFFFQMKILGPHVGYKRLSRRSSLRAKGRQSNAQRAMPEWGKFTDRKKLWKDPVIEFIPLPTSCFFTSSVKHTVMPCRHKRLLTSKYHRHSDFSTEANYLLYFLKIL